MKNLIRNLKLMPIVAIICIVLVSCVQSCMIASAKGHNVSILGNIYDLDKNSDYVIGESSPSQSAAIGILSMEGDVYAASEKDTFPAYEVRNDNVKFTYRLADGVLSRSEGEWHIIEDKAKKVNGVTLDDNVLSGALILQTSLDGINWTEDVTMSDIFANEGGIGEFYTTKDVQLQNGCYYRIVVAYKMERRLEDSKVLFVTNKNYEYKQVTEVYEFYAFCETDDTKPDSTPMKKLGKKINTGKDNGYSGNEPIDKDDPHYGWDIGYFYVNGYTRETVTADQKPVFLKNVGDKVTLWFHLSEDINKLHGNEHLTIGEDTNGYDREFEIEQTNFEHGTLIIQYIDPQGETHEPVIYTDYLAANTRTGANTKVQLFEEGDYIVALDYEIKSMGGPLNQIASHTNYKIEFDFSIRNGNCMVFPFDSLTGAELSDNAITENGFKLDMAKSKYLTIDVQRSILVVGTDGYLTEDIRFNRPAKDGETYTSEGIYNFEVSNLYTGQHTTKTIYVGSNSYLRALSATGMSIAELNAEIEKGAIVHDDGTVEIIVPPSITDLTESAESIDTGDTHAETKGIHEDASLESEETMETIAVAVTKTSSMNFTPYVMASLVVMFTASIFVARRRKKEYQERLKEDEVQEG